MDNRSAENGRQTRQRAPFVVLTAELLHETNTFSKFPTTLDDFFNDFFNDRRSFLADCAIGTSHLKKCPKIGTNNDFKTCWKHGNATNP